MGCVIPGTRFSKGVASDQERNINYVVSKHSNPLGSDADINHRKKFTIPIVGIIVGMRGNGIISHMGKSYSKDGMPALGPIYTDIH